MFWGLCFILLHRFKTLRRSGATLATLLSWVKWLRKRNLPVESLERQLGIGASERIRSLLVFIRKHIVLSPMHVKSHQANPYRLPQQTQLDDSVDFCWAITMQPHVESLTAFDYSASHLDFIPCHVLG